MNPPNTDVQYVPSKESAQVNLIKFSVTFKIINKLFTYFMPTVTCEGEEKHNNDAIHCRHCATIIYTSKHMKR